MPVWRRQSRSQKTILKEIKKRMDRTLAIFKPDCIKQKLLGAVIQKIENHGFQVFAMRMIRMSRPVAESFYMIHKDKPFFHELIDFITEGPCVVAVLYKKNAITEYRTLMGN